MNGYFNVTQTLIAHTSLALSFWGNETNFASGDTFQRINDMIELIELLIQIK